MHLGQLVNDELEKLRKFSIDQLLLLPEYEEKQIVVEGRKYYRLVFREDSIDGRTIIVVKVFDSGWLRMMAAANGFAITKDGEFVELNEEERATLY